MQWSWAGQFLSELRYRVQQTTDSSTDYDGTGFRSDQSNSGTFSHTFTKPGTYYYSSGPVDNQGKVVMKGKVVVKELSSEAQTVSLKLAGEPSSVLLLQIRNIFGPTMLVYRAEYIFAIARRIVDVTNVRAKHCWIDIRTNSK